MRLPYNPSDKSSIIEYAKKLKGKSLRQICDSKVLEHSYSGKGNFGQVLEKFYLDPKVLTAVEISALKVRVFGKSEKS